ncbi:hypothetical protein [Actinocrispum wychmicini]|uniref:DUF2269 domain-containing protein n=1 Tax=Actinocrispum wychmicini TaxID=1213861 RepID=A0A4R2JEI0_9PSEU|nr:hypothetical protein [Actinocrispum wychmicini]TCO55238.1 hypothetical protein EV192_108528 [Actinocrispum wychmicini]
MKLAKGTRRGLLVTHIVAAGTWIGMDVVMGVLVFTALSDRDLLAANINALAQFAVWPLLTAGLVCLVSGVLLGLGTRYGLVRYWWVAVKLALNVVLCTLVLFSLRPGVEEAVATGQPGDSMAFPPIVSTTALLFATFLSVYKPWGRVRKRTYAAVVES